MTSNDTDFAKGLLKKFKLNEATVSTVLGALVVIVIGVLIFNYFNKLGEDILPTEEISEGEVTEEGETGKEEVVVSLDDLPVTHKVEIGENLWEIAEKYYQSGYNWVDIAFENGLENPEMIAEGQELIIPAVEPIVLAQLPETGTTKGGEVLSGESITAEKYVVQTGDSLWNIAVRKYGDGFRYVEIAQANELGNPDLIHSGNEFVLPE